jgi:hypothetical protein
LFLFTFNLKQNNIYILYYGDYMDGTNINESSFDWFFNTIDRLKSGDIRPIDVFTFFCIFLLFDLI